jgi:HSP20 family protein
MSTGSLSPLPGDFSERLREQLRRLLLHFDELRLMATSPGAWMPPVDLCEMEDALLVNVELPGVARDSLRISIEDGMLKIEGRKERPPLTVNQGADDEKPLRFICLERAYGAFTRSVALKWMIDVQHVSARLANGILHIRLPKAEGCGREIVIPITEENGRQ